MELTSASDGFVLSRLATVLSALLPTGITPLGMYSTNDDPALDTLGRDVYCFFSSAIPLTLLRDESDFPSIRTLLDPLCEALSECQFQLESYSIVYYAERQGRPESLGFRVYAKRTD